MEGRYPAGRIAQLWRYPVKSLAPESLRTIEVGPLGLEGDRERALFVESPEHARSGREYRGKENNLLHTTGDAERAIELAAERGVAIASRSGGPHFDAASISIVFDTWIADLETLAGKAVDPQRFRPNIFVVAEPGFALREADLAGATIEAGTAAFNVLEPTARCVTPSYDLATGVSDNALLRTIVPLRANVMGVYCSVATEGRIEIGATLWITPP